MDSFFPSLPRPYSPYAPARRSRRKPRGEAEVDPATPAERAAEIDRIARQLQKIADSLAWGRVQNNAWDRLCPFIFRLRSVEAVTARAAEVGRQNPEVADADELVRYARRRWYCFWCARLSELLFLDYPNARPGPPKDHQVDLYLDDVPFDLKTSEVPRAFVGGLAELLGDPARAVAWFYTHQSQERRFHLGNRLFLVLGDPEDPGQAWRLRGDVAALRAAIDAFMARPAYVHLNVRGRDGLPRPVKSGIIPVLRLAALRQLRLTLPPGPGAGREAHPPPPPPEQPRLPF